MKQLLEDPPHLAIKVNSSNPNHHLWNNHGWWWMKYTIHTRLTKERKLLNLLTRDVEAARRSRDQVLSSFAK